MPTDPRDLEPEEIREALDELREDLEIQDKPNAIRLVEVQLALATMAARMLEEGSVRGAYLRPERWGGRAGWDPVLTSHPRATDRPLYALPETIACPEPGGTDD